MLNNKAKYHKLLETETSIPIFSRTWWMDAVCGEDNWDVLLVEKNNEIIASMPYYKKKKYGLTAITQPLMTQTNGVWLRPSKAKYAKKLSQQKDLMNSLIAQLPEVDYFCQNFPPYITNWLPFHWAGFKQTTNYTYRIEDISNPEIVWQGFLDNVRTDIRKAEKSVIVRNDLGLDDFLRVNSLTFERQGMLLPYTPEFVANLDSACVSQNARRMFFAEDAKGRIHAAIYTIWDSNTAYYLMGGGDPELRNSGATSLLVWEAIKHASKVSTVFDFEGSMIESVERFIRAFGAVQTPYYQISRMSRRMRMAYHGKEMIKTLLKN